MLDMVRNGSDDLCELLFKGQVWQLQPTQPDRKKLLPKQLHVSSANVKGLEIRPSLAPILL